jgi:hypothetical protein
MLAAVGCDGPTVVGDEPLPDSAVVVGPFQLVQGPELCEVHGSVRNTTARNISVSMAFDAFDATGKRIGIATGGGRALRIGPLGTADYAIGIVHVAPGSSTPLSCRDIARVALDDVSVFGAR